MTKNHARKEKVRRRMKENANSSYQAELNTMSATETGAANAAEMPNADRREDFVDAVVDADLPQVVNLGRARVTTLRDHGAYAASV
jgi:hypothetical protein